MDAGAGDTVTLRNLSIHGTWPTVPTNMGTGGISVQTANTVHIEHCVVAGFVTGISIEPTSELNVYVDDTIARDNSTNIELGSNTIASITHSRFSGSLNAWGIFISGGGVQVTISDTEANGNSEGLIITNSYGAFSAVFVRNSVFSNNSGYGVLANGPGIVVTLNNTSIANNTNGGISTSNGASVQSFGNNANNGTGTPDQSLALQ
ncbi:MAG: right-handed parallel beta-helix repeat-containing protein [Terracidiphilus sp.]